MVDHATDETEPGAEQPVTGAARTERVREYRGVGVMWGAIALAVLSVAFVIVVIQNSDNVVFEFLWISVSTPLSLIIAVAVAASLAVGEFTGYVWRRHRRSDLQRREELRRLRGSP